MLILGMDTTAVTASVAIAEIDGSVQKYSLFTMKNRLTHSENLMPMIKQTIELYGADPGEISLIAVSAGPGSFTGVRIGVATAKGLAFAYGGKIPCASISTLQALAENLSHNYGIICPVMDARRHQFYNALFKGGKRMCEDRLISSECLKEQLLNINEPVIICGDGAEFFYQDCEKVDRIKIASPSSRDQNALSVAVCGYKAYLNGEAVNAQELKPIYLRASQAERKRLGLE